jgi:hypothetical protein
MTSGEHSRFYPLPSLVDSTTAADVYGCCVGKDCPHEVVDYDVLLLVRDGHGHVTRVTARLVLGVHGPWSASQTAGSLAHCVGFGPGQLSLWIVLLNLRRIVTQAYLVYGSICS